MTSSIARVFVVGVLAAAAGCVRYVPRPLTAPETLRAYENRRLDAPDVVAALTRGGLVTVWPPSAWDLNALTLVAFHYHPDLEVARMQWSVSRAAVLRAGERPNPGAGIAPGVATSSPVGLTPWLLVLDLTFPIETAGKRGIRVAQAAAEAEAARFAIATEAWRVRARVRDSLLALYAASEQAALLTRQLEVQTQMLGLLQRQFDAGAISSLELSRGRVSADNTRLLLRDLDRRRAEARVGLAAALGVAQEALDPVTLSFERFRGAPTLLNDGAVRQQALVSRPDVLRALASYEAAQRSLQLEIARQYPGLQLGPGYELDQGDHKWRLIASGLLPVLSRNRGAIEEAEARRAAAAASFTAVQATALAQIDAALAAARGALETLATAEDLLRQQRAVEQTATARFDAGAISRLDLAVVQLETLALERAVLDARVTAHAAAHSLEEAIQSPLDLERWLRIDPEAAATSPEEASR